jgi:hypothetical protein
MTSAIQRFMIVEAVCFTVAALVHGGVLLAGYEHREARIAESVLAIVLFIGLLLTWVRPGWERAAGIAAQGFALLGTLVGIFTIIVGVGPRTAPDVIYHIAIVAVLVWGLVVALRTPAR